MSNRSYVHAHRTVAVPECACQTVHPDRVAAARAYLPGAELTGKAAEFFSVFGDPTRIGIIAALSAGELCVCDLAACLGMSQSAVSHQLRVMRQAGLVRARREGKTASYSLSDAHVRTVFRQGMAHAAEGARA
jgi:ArsR family transcriptional regulator